MLESDVIKNIRENNNNHIVLHGIVSLPSIDFDSYIKAFPELSNEFNPPIIVGRMVNLVRQFNLIASERIELINKALIDFNSSIPFDVVERDLRQIHQRTLSLAIQIESILDCAMSTSNIINRISNKIRSDLIRRRFHGFRVMRYLENNYHIEVLNSLRHIIDILPDYRDRSKYHGVETSMPIPLRGYDKYRYNKAMQYKFLRKWTPNLFRCYRRMLKPTRSIKNLG